MAAIRKLLAIFTFALALAPAATAQQPDGRGPLFRNIPPDLSTLPESQPTVATPVPPAPTRPARNKAAQAAPAQTQTAQPPIVTPAVAAKPALRGSAPLRPEQLPANAPRVSYQGGQLTVVAENSTFADVVASIRAATGIKMDSPANLTGDRVAAKIGPASVKDVLLSLFDGSRYDYVIVGSMTDPNAVTQVVLTPRLASGAAPNPSAVNRQQPPSPVVTHDEPEDGPLEDGEAEGFAPEQKQPQPIPQAQPDQFPPQPNVNPGGVKTPQQLLEDLRRMERERQQRANPNERNPREPRP